VPPEASASSTAAVDVRRVDQAEPEVREPARLARDALGRALERDHVVRARALHLDAVRVAEVLAHAEQRRVEAQRAIGIAHREVEMREAVRSDRHAPNVARSARDHTASPARARPYESAHARAQHPTSHGSASARR
jgi:hypothetical protein